MALYLIYGAAGDPSSRGELRIAYEIQRGDAGLFDVLERGETVIELPAAKDGSKRRDLAAVLDARAAELVVAAAARLDSFAEAVTFVTGSKARWPLEANGFGELLRSADPAVPVPVTPAALAERAAARAGGDG